MEAEEILSLLLEMDELRPEARAYIQAVLQDTDSLEAQRQELESLVGPAIDGMHAIAFELYHHGHYEQAAVLYRLLSAKEPLNADFWMGLGASLQMNSKYEDALTPFAMAASIEIENPQPHLHAAECYFGMLDRKEGFEALGVADSFCTNRPEHQGIKQRIAVLREAWSNADL